MGRSVILPTVGLRSFSMRALLLLILGLVVGAMGATFAVNALRQRDAYPRAVMTVMQQHAGALHARLRARQCDAATSAAHLGRMQAISEEIMPAFPDMDPPFKDGVDKLQRALASAASAAPVDCPALQQALKPVDEACKSCHQQYR
jgi:cytochrome c556